MSDDAIEVKSFFCAELQQFQARLLPTYFARLLA
jgi:hypothetical protein